MRRDELCAVVQVGVELQRRGDVAVADPVGDGVDRDAALHQQRRAGVAQIVEPDARQTVLFQQRPERRGHIAGAEEVPELVHEDVADELRIVGVSGELPVFLLPGFQRHELRLKPRRERHGAAAGAVLGAVLLHQRLLAVDLALRHRVADREHVSLKVDGVPFEPQRLAAAHPVERDHLKQKPELVGLGGLEQRLQLLGVVVLRLVVVVLRRLGLVRRVEGDQIHHHRVLERTVDVGVLPADGAAGDLLQTVEIVRLDVPPLQLAEGDAESAEPRGDVLVNVLHIAVVGRDGGVALCDGEPRDHVVGEEHVRPELAGLALLRRDKAPALLREQLLGGALVAAHCETRCEPGLLPLLRDRIAVAQYDVVITVFLLQVSCYHVCFLLSPAAWTKPAENLCSVYRVSSSLSNVQMIFFLLSFLTAAPLFVQQLQPAQDIALHLLVGAVGGEEPLEVIPPQPELLALVGLRF